MLNPSVLKNYVATFFGYGQWNAPIWFVGIEEAGGMTERELEQRLAVWASRGKNELEDAPTFYPASGNHSWHGEHATGQATWKQLIRLLLVASGECDDNKAVTDYQRTKLGSSTNDTCLAELLPLPSPDTATWYYREWSELPWLQTRTAFEQKILCQRIWLLRQRIDRHHPRAVIFYGDGQLKHWCQIMGNGDYLRPIPNKLIAHER